MQYNLIINVEKVIGFHWWTRLETGFYHWDVWASDLWPSFAHHRVLPLVLAWYVHHCQTLNPRSVFVSFLCICVRVFTFVYEWIMTGGGGVHVSFSERVCVCACVWVAARVEHVLAFSEEQQGSNKD